jgi:hypothetical protein
VFGKDRIFTQWLARWPKEPFEEWAMRFPKAMAPDESEEKSAKILAREAMISKVVYDILAKRDKPTDKTVDKELLIIL